MRKQSKPTPATLTLEVQKKLDDSGMFKKPAAELTDDDLVQGIVALELELARRRTNTYTRRKGTDY